MSGEQELVSREAREIAAKLTEAMRDALHRLCDNKVWIDGRSRRALVRRGLASEHGEISDEMLGRFTIVYATPLGLAVRSLLNPQPEEGE